MKLYFVSCSVICGNQDRYLVKANNKKEALNKVWNEYYIPKNESLKGTHYDPYLKKDLYVQDVEKELFENPNDTIVQIW